MLSEEQNQQANQDSSNLDIEQMKKIEFLLYKVLDPEARERLNNVRLVNIERYLQVANFLINSAQRGKLELPVDDSTLKQILLQARDSRDFNIKRK
ncbi:MAG: hypothetical protein COT14_03535 [Candidatus Diapherotrites archaeon CG08_land_8_20_14_0_20_30_16]|nr:MAG: hypothetical protein COT14_03535 [Candidatus Diapherotrites archaeon CG08_land_8_20_14_0_20_30_16]